MISNKVRRSGWIFAVAAGLAAAGPVRGETIGPYNVVATPASAVLVSGGGALFNWLNVVNAPVSINEALTGFSVIDDGYANAQSGTTLRLTFDPGVLRNHPGSDLVLLDANNDLNQYRVRTSYDGFSREILVNASSDTGVDRNYYFGGQGPAAYDVYAGTIDLSSLNIPEDQTVNTIQLFTEGPSNDPLGLGVLAVPGPVPSLSQWGLIVTSLLLFAVGTKALLRRSPTHEG